MEAHRAEQFQTGLIVRTSRPSALDVSSAPAEASGYSVAPLSGIWRRWPIILGCTLASMIAGVIYLVRTPHSYESSSTILLEQSIPKAIRDSVANSSNSTGYLDTQCQVIRSTTILAAALKDPSVKSVQAVRNADDPVLALKGVVTAEPDKDGDAIVVSVVCSDPNDAAAIANGVVSAYLSFQMTQSASTADQVLSVLGDEMRRREDELAELHRRILELKTNPDVGRMSVESGRLTALSDELTRQHEQTFDLKMAAAEARMIQDDPDRLIRLINMLSGQQTGTANYGQTIIDPILLFQYRDAQRKLKELIEDQGLGDSNPAVQVSRKRLERLQAEMRASAGDVTRQLAEEADESLHREAALQQELQQEQESASQTNGKAALFDELSERAQREERAIDVLDTQIKEVDVTEDVAGRVTGSVLEPAKPELVPIGPRRASSMCISLIAGLTVGLCAAMFRERTDQHLRCAQQVMAAFQMPILGVIPPIGGKSDLAHRGRVMALNPSSLVAEIYRSIRVTMDFGRDGGPPHTLLFTSPQPGDGKTTSVCNLAVAFATSGRRVLLIDADCRRPSVHKVFGLKPTEGLSDVLEGRAPWQRVVCSTDVPRLEILPCTTVPENPGELLHRREMDNLLEEAGRNYDRVLLDSSPLVAVSDARVLAPRADATVLVVRESRCVRAMAELARFALQSVGASALGVLINDSRSRRNAAYMRCGYSESAPSQAEGAGGWGARWVQPRDTAFSPIAVDVAPSRTEGCLDGDAAGADLGDGREG